MAVESNSFSFSTEAELDIVDITDNVANIVGECDIHNGIATVFVPGSTGAITTLEYEPGLVQDMAEFFERVAPRDASYRHEERWHDKNGHSHIRASIIGPSLSVPFRDGRLMLGTWQQIIFLDCDVRSREREIVVQIFGDRE
ncbi:MAG: secondary thiamine-phosphate synthase enzyme YjbQ [Planctomycetota bacterium]